MSYFVLLQSRGNPDFRQNPDEALSPEVVLPVADWAAASERCAEYIAAWELGGGNWTGGQITDESGQLVARVSYNGRVWSPGPWQDAKLLYAPI
jgi:hypothetical protein